MCVYVRISALVRSVSRIRAADSTTCLPVVSAPAGEKEQKVQNSFSSFSGDYEFFLCATTVSSSPSSRPCIRLLDSKTMSKDPVRERTEGRKKDRSTSHILLLLILCSAASPSLTRTSATGKSGKLTLHAAGFFPVSTRIREGSIGRGVLPAVDLALDHINDSPTILRDIHLDLFWNDTQVTTRFDSF